MRWYRRWFGSSVWLSISMLRRSYRRSRKQSFVIIQRFFASATETRFSLLNWNHRATDSSISQKKRHCTIKRWQRKLDWVLTKSDCDKLWSKRVESNIFERSIQSSLTHSSLPLRIKRTQWLMNLRRVVNTIFLNESRLCAEYVSQRSISQMRKYELEELKTLKLWRSYVVDRKLSVAIDQSEASNKKNRKRLQMIWKRISWIHFSQSASQSNASFAWVTIASFTRSELLSIVK